MAPPLWYPRGIIWMATWRILHSRQILHAAGAISVLGGFFSPGEGWTQALGSRSEHSTDWATTAFDSLNKHCTVSENC